MSFAIAIDLGGTQIRAALVDLNGKVHNRIAIPTPADTDGDTVVQHLADAALDVSKTTDRSNIIGVGLSSPGPLDTTTGITHGLPTIKGFDDFPLKQKFQDKLPHKLFVENDGIAAAIGEWQFGAGIGFRSVVYITVSTGIGGGVIVDNTVLRGRKGMAGHVGHLAIYPDGLRCSCGNAGCWEAYAAGPAFAARASKALGKTIKPKEVFELAAAGHKAAQAQVDEQARLLGIGITSLLHLYSPEVVVIGGGLSNAFDQFIPGIQKYVESNAMLPFRDVPIRKAALSGNSGLIGAAALVFQNT
jgi:glucokinase